MNQVSDSRILIVDDETGVTRLCERFLRRAGYQTYAANHPQEGIRFFQNRRIDLLLVDIRMPEMDGFELMSLARQHQPDLAIVIMTGYGTVETAVESLRQGADGMVLKPFSGAELVQSVEQALREKQREREMLQLQALRPLFDISESLFAEKSPERLRVRLLEVVYNHFRCSHASFYQQIVPERTWHQVAVQGKDFALNEHWLADWKNLETPSSFNIEEDIADQDFAQVFQRWGLGFFIVIPLYLSDQRQILFAARDLSDGGFGASELETLFILSRQALVALENARLYDELQARVRQVESSQQALIQAEKMAAVGRLTTSIAHEINNPLHSVRNCLHLAGRQELSNIERQEYLELASQEMDRLMHTVRQMLDFYRPGALDRKPADLNQLIGRVLKLLDNQLSDQSVIVHDQFSSDLPAVLVVENQIQQVFFNLFLNAMEAMPTGGEIYIHTTCDQDNVIVFFEDTGPGVIDKQRDEIFEPFVSSKEQGLGLGLTVSYGIVTAHGGSLSLLPRERRGARFQLSLPKYD